LGVGVQERGQWEGVWERLVMRRIQRTTMQLEVDWMRWQRMARIVMSD
jgi:hypothetical protein